MSIGANGVEEWQLSLLLCLVYGVDVPQTNVVGIFLALIYTASHDGTTEASHTS